MGTIEEKILVSVRLRPLNDKEIARNDVSDWECVNENTIIFKNANLPVPERSMYPTAYTFDRVFRSDCSTKKVYEEGAKEVALSVVSATIFAYGQTSSGKTFTMTGITEHTLADIYEYIGKHREREYHLKFSAMEIYNESVRDLLSTDTTPLRLLDDPERGTVVEKLTEEPLGDWNHVMELLSICEAQRQIGETALNETSSRSHQIIRLTIESSTREFLSRDNSSTLAASVNFVDLAGSERASQSLSAGTRLKEGCHINRSLLTLGTVIRKLSKGRNGHIPFRDSKLTRILQSSLGGNAKTAIICTMSPARSHVEQSRNTLLFASCAKEVTTNAQVNVFVSDKALVKHLQRELARLESELRGPGSSFVVSHYSALLQEKELQIDKMEKEIIDLTLQRDVAQSQFQDLLRLVGDDRDSMRWVGLNNYPHLHVLRSPECENPILSTSPVADPRSLDAAVRTIDSYQYSYGHSESSSDDHCIPLPDFEETFMQNDTSPRLLVPTSKFIRRILHRVGMRLRNKLMELQMICNTPPNGLEKEFSGRPENIQRKLSELSYCDDVERLSRKGSRSSVGNAAATEVEAQKDETLPHETVPSLNACVSEVEENAKVQLEKQVTDSPVHEAELKSKDLKKLMKTLQRERETLSRQMQKRLSVQDRESLYLKWGIKLNSKYRRLQLASRLWTDTQDMDHISDSAFIVAKLVGFEEPGQAPKEMFGLNFAPQPPRRRSYSLKRSVISLL
ncbi:hypothetical protein C3L33_17768, partial [Rhododendron williamsianum]